MIEFLKWALILGISSSWIILLVIFWELGVMTWKMGDKLGASLFFLVDLSVVLMFAILLFA